MRKAQQSAVSVPTQGSTQLSATASPFTPPSSTASAIAAAPKAAPQPQRPSSADSASSEEGPEIPNSSDRPTLRESPFGVHWMSLYVHAPLLKVAGMEFVSYPGDVLQFLYPARPGDDAVVAPNVELPDNIPLLGDKCLTRLFFGHLWIRLPTVVLQWLINAFTPDIFPKPILYHPQKHYAVRGTSRYYKGCAHITAVGASLELIEKTRKRLHGRFLFDSRGVWVANTEVLQHLMRGYCKNVRVLPQGERHAQLQSLPCNVMSCEVPQNDPSSSGPRPR